MATKSQFTQINATQWNTLGARFQARIDLFSPALAEKIPYELAAAMSASPTFLTLLDRQAVFRDADGSITVGSGTEANVRGGGNAAIISINPSEIILFVNQPATMVLRFAHELGHATRPDGVGGFTDLNGVVWPSPFAYHQVVGPGLPFPILG